MVEGLPLLRVQTSPTCAYVHDVAISAAKDGQPLLWHDAAEPKVCTVQLLALARNLTATIRPARMSQTGVLTVGMAFCSLRSMLICQPAVVMPLTLLMSIVLAMKLCQLDALGGHR